MNYKHGILLFKYRLCHGKCQQHIYQLRSNSIISMRVRARADVQIDDQTNRIHKKNHLC